MVFVKRAHRRGKQVRVVCVIRHEGRKHLSGERIDPMAHRIGQLHANVGVGMLSQFDE